MNSPGPQHDAHRVTLIHGDGVGPELVEAARLTVEATGIAIAWDVQPAGSAAALTEGAVLPDRTVSSIRQSGVALKGPTATKTSGERAVSPELRSRLGLHTGVRPCRSVPGVPGSVPGIDVVLVRMNHEDLYAGVEYEAGSPEAARLRETATGSGHEVPVGAAVSLRFISSAAARRSAGVAFELARREGRGRVTAVHKATVMRHTDGAFLDGVEEAAARYPGVQLDSCLIDTLCYRAVTRPSALEVLVMPVMYGDIVSDLLAGLTGGLGLAPGANLGEGVAVFEAVHGTAPGHADCGTASPVGVIRSAAMMLEHLGEHEAGRRLRVATDASLSEAVAERPRPLAAWMASRIAEKLARDAVPA